MCCILPRHLNSPLTIIVSLVHNASHSSILRRLIGNNVDIEGRVVREWI